MPHSTPTTNSVRRWRIALGVVAALFILGAVAWKFGFALLGLTPVGECTVTKGSETSQISHEEAESLFEQSFESGEPLGRTVLSCSYTPRFGGNDLTLNDRGLTSSAQSMDEAVRAQFGRIPDGGYQPGGVTTGHIPGSAHYEGRAIDYFFRPYTREKKRLAGWQLAQWAVLNAEKLDISTIIFDDHIWMLNSSAQGWQKYTHPSGNTDNPILRHLDHVHIDVR